VTDSKLVDRASRRRFTTACKLAIMREADACSKPIEIGALMRREGSYSSHLCKWREQRDQGARRVRAQAARSTRPERGRGGERWVAS
jgi:transposase